MSKLTYEQVGAYEEFKKDTIEVIRGAVEEVYVTNSSDDDDAIAAEVFEWLLAQKRLLLPELSESESPATPEGGQK